MDDYRFETHDVCPVCGGERQFYIEENGFTVCQHCLGAGFEPARQMDTKEALSFLLDKIEELEDKLGLG